MNHTYAGPEAKQWLESNGQDAPLASNRFGSKKQALDFINSLYAAGATRVFIPTENIRDDAMERQQGGPYADAIVAEFAPKNRAEIVRIFQRDAEQEGYDEPVTGHDGWIFFWWD